MAHTQSERAIALQGVDGLLKSLVAEGYALIGPRWVDGAISYAEIGSVEDLPRGMTEVQQAGRYQLLQTAEQTLFRFASTAGSFKRFFHPPEVRLFSLRKSADGAALIAPALPSRKLALIGARACDIAALRILDGVLTAEPHPHSDYVARRRDVFVIAVNCATAGGTCFCHSAGTGPRVTEGFDLSLGEIESDGVLEFVVTSGSEAGAKLLNGVSSDPATPQQLELAEAQSQACEASLSATALDLSDVHAALQRNVEHPRWQDVADRCLSCGNCTAVCPTCFCTDRVEKADEEGLSGQTEIWDSCFTADFSHLHGGAVRGSTRARYRQWLTHKFSTWFDQFGNSGCVGCGRCVTWCPVGIDVREELSILASAKSQPGSDVGTAK